jgi:two-component system LytT family response regulator
MNAIIVEDKEPIRKGLIQLLTLIDKDINVVGECESVQEGLIVLKACKPDLVFLDINLTDGTGFDLLEQIESIDFKVIFITAYEEFALRALKIGAVDYLLKPVDIEELETAIDKLSSESVPLAKNQILMAKKVLNDDKNTLILSLQDAFQVIDLEELMYCESDKGYTTFYMSDGKKHLASKSIKEFEEQLISQYFTRPHQSFIVNLKFIDRYDKSGTIYLKSGGRIPVSSRKKNDFLDVLFKWNKE